jgi:hypothetical protein
MIASETQAPGRSAGRIVLIVVGACVALVALVSLVGGGVLVGIHATERDADGYYTSGANELTTPTRALVSDTLDIGNDAPDWIFSKGRLGTVRVTATSSGSEPIFVGVARASQVDTYFQGVAHDEIKDFDLDPFSVTSTRHAGAAIPAAPAAQRIWTKSASGTGPRTVTWPVQEGRWAVVVMNADGSPGIVTDVSVGAKLGYLLWVGIVLLVLGAFVAIGAGALMFAGTRRPPSTPSTATATGPPLAAEGATS